MDRWVIAQSSQTFAVFFNVGALASALYLVAFSDLAFSWSTTLQLEAADLQRWTDLLSAPWAPFFAGARPSPELIETTRYFRLQDGSFPAAVSPAGLGGWWPFLVMCMAVYGLLPRLLTWFAGPPATAVGPEPVVPPPARRRRPAGAPQLRAGGDAGRRARDPARRDVAGEPRRRAGDQRRRATRPW